MTAINVTAASGAAVGALVTVACAVLGARAAVAAVAGLVAGLAAAVARERRRSPPRLGWAVAAFAGWAALTWPIVAIVAGFVEI